MSKWNKGTSISYVSMILEIFNIPLPNVTTESISETPLESYPTRAINHDGYYSKIIILALELVQKTNKR